MITGAHAILYSKDSDADRAFLKDVLGLGHVDVGGGWLIFALPPSEVAVHPGKKNAHELFLTCEDVDAFRVLLDDRGVESSSVSEQGWGRLTTVTLPGGGKLGVYQPRHARPGSGSGKRGATTKRGGGAAKGAAVAAAAKAKAKAKTTKRTGNSKAKGKKASRARR
ncbi:MAG TPA: VOC family protein [Polyangiaceae bacterium]|jgi:hypothetical protein|nr:VOC family protein [Polyangiaceae bacterium]